MVVHESINLTVHVTGLGKELVKSKSMIGFSLKLHVWRLVRRRFRLCGRLLVESQHWSVHENRTKVCMDS
jgi:hypothetical protein